MECSYLFERVAGAGTLPDDVLVVIDEPLDLETPDASRKARNVLRVREELFDDDFNADRKTRC